MILDSADAELFFQWTGSARAHVLWRRSRTTGAERCLSLCSQGQRRWDWVEADSLKERSLDCLCCLNFLPVSKEVSLQSPSYGMGVPVVAQWLTSPTSIHEGAGSIPGLTQWVKDPALQ